MMSWKHRRCVLVCVCEVNETVGTGKGVFVWLLAWEFGILITMLFIVLMLSFLTSLPLTKFVTGEVILETWTMIWSIIFFLFYFN